MQNQRLVFCARTFCSLRHAFYTLLLPLIASESLRSLGFRLRSKKKRDSQRRPLLLRGMGPDDNKRMLPVGVESHPHTEVDFLFSHNMLFSGENTRTVQLPNLIAMGLENERLTPCPLILMIMSNGKRNQLVPNSDGCCLSPSIL